MLFEKVPHVALAKIFDISLILHAEHTMNASTFSGLVTASTLADPYTVISSSIGTLKGPLHGGANEEVIHMLRDIGEVEKVPAYLERKLANKEKVMGFGHRVYKVKDPRAIVLQDLAQQLESLEDKSPLFRVARAVEREMERLVGHKGIRANVDFYSGLIYHRMGIETGLVYADFCDVPGRGLAGSLL